MSVAAVSVKKKSASRDSTACCPAVAHSPDAPICRSARLPYSCAHPAPCQLLFQAEDAIRHYRVTGVQTCALPIYGAGFLAVIVAGKEVVLVIPGEDRVGGYRSEERRVGKEGRSRWSPYH